MKFILLLGIFFPLVVVAAEGADSEQTLKAFYESEYKARPVTDLTHGNKGSLQWQKDKKARRYKSRLMEAWKDAKEPNFAGHYFAVDSIGCGSGCFVVFVIEWETGRIFYPPGGDHVFAFRRDSRLLILKNYDECGPYGAPLLYDFKDSRFIAVPHSYCQASP